MKGLYISIKRVTKYVLHQLLPNNQSENLPHVCFDGNTNKKVTKQSPEH